MNAPLKTAELSRNAAFAAARNVRLSVLIPFYRDNPCALLKGLCAKPPGGVEIILYDDGSDDSALGEAVREAVLRAPLAAMLVSARNNYGRAFARNTLTGAARGEWVLLLDADMMPPNAAFLQRWCACIKEQAPAVAFGGFAVPPLHSVTPAHRLHLAFSQSSDCLPAAIRAQNPASTVCTSNLLVRRDVLRTHPFDDGFDGWGWEDVEWAARVARDHSIVHIDNPALHLGLETPETLLQRFRDSAANYARFVQRHPALARTLPSWKAAHIAAAIPGFSFFCPVFAAIARNALGLWPLPARILALKLWRSSWYAKALP